MPSFIPIDPGYSLGHHCVGIQVANGNSPIISPTLLTPCLLSIHLTERQRKKTVKQRVGREESVKLVTQIPPSTSAPPVGGGERVDLWVDCEWNGLWGESASGHRLTQCQNSSANRISFSLTASVSCSFDPTTNWGKFEQRINSLFNSVFLIFDLGPHREFGHILFDCNLKFDKQITTVVCFYQLRLLTKVNPFLSKSNLETAIQFCSTSVIRVLCRF